MIMKNHKKIKLYTQYIQIRYYIVCLVYKQYIPIYNFKNTFNSFAQKGWFHILYNFEK